MKKTLTQLFTEFWLPLTAASLWTLLQWHNGSITTEGWGKITLGLIEQFAPSFFFVSFLTGQWFRVRKQQKVEGGLSTVESRLQGLLTALETRTAEVIGHLTGGDSHCYLMASVIDNVVRFTLINGGNYRMEDVQARFVDLDNMDALIASGNFRSDLINRIEMLGALGPGMCRDIGTKYLVAGKDSFRVNVFFNAKNGNSFQCLRLKRVDGKWLQASQVTSPSGQIVDYTNEAFPGDPGFN
jgi:hypothetical protein